MKEIEFLSLYQRNRNERNMKDTFICIIRTKTYFLFIYFIKQNHLNSQKYTVGNLHNFYEKSHVGYFGRFSFIVEKIF